MQQILYAGDTLRFTTDVPDYPATDGYTLSYLLARRDGSGALITIVASQLGSGYEVNVAPATTATWTPGKYTWRSKVTKALEAHTLEGSRFAGEIEILADIASVTAPYDNRSHARKTLDAIQALIEGRATVDQQEISLGGRSLKLMDPADLLVWLDKYTWMVRQEEEAARLAAGLPSRNRVLTRFTR